MNKFRSAIGRKTAGFTLIEIMIVVLIIGILLAIAIPNFITARNSSRAQACIANLKQIDSAKQQYIMDNKLPGTASFADLSNLVPTYIRATPSCPAGGTYTPGDGQTDPTCSYVTTGTNDTPHVL